MTFALSYRAVSSDAGKYGHSIEVDARGHFLAEDVPPGTYELALKPRDGLAFEPITRNVTVANGARDSSDSRSQPRRKESRP